VCGKKVWKQSEWPGKAKRGDPERRHHRAAIGNPWPIKEPWKGLSLCRYPESKFFTYERTLSPHLVKIGKKCPLL
jgi:hypothetical protein